MKKEEKVFASFSKRLGASMLNLLFYLIIAFSLEYCLGGLTFKKWVHYEDNKYDFNQMTELYHEKQDFYQIYTYNEDDKRIYNLEVSQEQLDAFNNDQSVIDLTKDIKAKQAYLVGMDLLSYGVFFVASSYGLTILMAIIFSKYKSFGNLCLGLYTVNENDEKLTHSKYFGYSSVRYLLLYPLGILSIFIIPVCFLYQIFYDDNHQTSLEKKFGLITILKG